MLVEPYSGAHGRSSRKRSSEISCRCRWPLAQSTFENVLDLVEEASEGLLEEIRRWRLRDDHVS